MKARSPGVFRYASLSDFSICEFVRFFDMRVCPIFRYASLSDMIDNYLSLMYNVNAFAGITRYFDKSARKEIRLWEKELLYCFLRSLFSPRSELRAARAVRGIPRAAGANILPGGTKAKRLRKEKKTNKQKNILNSYCLKAAGIRSENAPITMKKLTRRKSLYRVRITVNP